MTTIGLFVDDMHRSGDRAICWLAPASLHWTGQYQGAICEVRLWRHFPENQPPGDLKSMIIRLLHPKEPAVDYDNDDEAF
jgi:hypothetical protein